MAASGIRMGKVFVEIGADPSKLFGALNRINRRIGQVGAAMQQVGARMTAVGVALATPLGLATRHFASFDDAIRATAAVTGSLGVQGAAALAMLTDKARELGRTTSFTAVEVANLMTTLGRAGFKPDEINAMTSSVLALARATGTDATLSAGIMAATLRQFGLGAESASRAADLLTYAANNSFNTVEDLGESLKYAGPVAKGLGMSLEDTIAILGVLGNVGIQGSQAGTSIRRLAVIAAGAGKELQELFGISNTDAAGNLKPLVQILDEISSATANMSVADRTAKMAKAFGLRGITSANVLAGSAGSVKAFAEGMNAITGLAQKTASAMDAGLGGSMRKALSAFEGVALAIGEALAPSIRAAVDLFTSLAGIVTGFITANQGLVVGIAKAIAGFTGFSAGVFLSGFAISRLSQAIAILSSVGLASAAKAVVGFAASSGAALAGFAIQAGAAVAWVAAGLGVVAARSVVAASITAANFAAMSAVYALTAAKAIASFALLNTAIGGYVLKVLLAVSAVSAAAVANSVAWVSAALPGVVAFATSAGAALSGYVAACLSTAAAAIASAASTAAAWLVAVAPILGAAAAVVALGAAVYFAAKAAFQVGQVLGSVFSSVATQGAQSFAAIYAAASNAFGGIYDAIAGGDLALAMDILMAGLWAGWAKGSELLLNAIDDFSNAMYDTLAFAFINVKAFVLGTVDNLVNGVLDSFDDMRAAVLKSWNYVQSFLKQGYDLAAENNKVETETAARKAARGASRPGISGRVEQDTEEFMAAKNERDITANALRAQRASASLDAMNKLEGLRQQAADTRQDVGAARELETSISQASSLDQLGGLGSTLADLIERGNLPTDREQQLIDAYNQASQRIGEATTQLAANAEGKADPGAMRDAAIEAAAAQAETVGTFSSVGFGGMGFGSSLQEMANELLRKIEENTREPGVIGP